MEHQRYWTAGNQRYRGRCQVRSSLHCYLRMTLMLVLHCRIRPTEKELDEMDSWPYPEFRSGWDSYFKDKPDKP